MAKPSLRKVGAAAAAGCAALLGARAARRLFGRGAEDPPVHARAEEDVEALATDEGMPEAPTQSEG